MANTKGQIFGINGPVVKVKGSDSFEMQEMVYVGNEELIGEVIGVTSDTTIVQVYEETTGLKKGEPVQLIGFGTFKVNKRAARTGRNPQTGAEIKIAASKVPAFVSGKALKDAIK